MKHNFILSKENCHIFLSRFKKLLSMTGMVVKQGDYNGTKKLNSVLPKNSSVIRKLVEKTSKSYIDVDTVEYDPSGFRFAASAYTSSNAYSVLGPLHSQQTREKSKRFAELVAPIFRPIHNPK